MSDTETNDIDSKDIAVVGMAGRFPGAKDLDTYWRNLCAGVESITFFSHQELADAGIDPALLNNPSYVKAGSVLDDIESFDASFFGFTPREAVIMDPQQRIFLECAWEALENAGVAPEAYPGMVGVYAGAAWNTYLLNNLVTNRSALKFENDNQIFVANDKDFMPTRVSYKLNLRGPSVNVQTACSSSLVAIHLACLGLWNYECDLALAGGVCALVPQKTGYLYLDGGFDSPDGHCRTFDAKAAGTVFGSGMGIVVLKRLADALEDGDYIHAVVKGSAINNDGSLKVSYTAPSVDGQAEVIAAALSMADVAPETISYIEAHGTGTSLGDPIELTALTKAFRASTQKKGFCAIGSVKSNIGHLSVASGVAGFIKTVLALKHRQIPPSLHFEQPNPNIDFANSPFFVNTSLSEWRTNGQPRRAGVSSFGIGGTNAHVIVEEAPVATAARPSRPWQLLLLSAKTSTALEHATANLAAYLHQMSGAASSQRNTSEDTASQSSVLSPQSSILADAAYTTQTGRTVFRHRRALVCRDRDDAIAALEALDPQRVATERAANDSRERPVVFMFPGQGAQHVAMARGLYESEPTFREHVDHCCELLIPELGVDLRDLLYPDQRQEDKESGSAAAPQSSVLSPQSSVLDLDQTQYAQPALFVVEYALARLWMEWGVHPRAMIGHSVGEYVVACLAGVFSLEDALALVAARGKLMQQLPAGAMLSVSLPEAQVVAQLAPELALAALNAPDRCVVSGPTPAIEQFERRLVEQGVKCRRLHTSHAFHSAMMDAIVEPFTQQVRRIQLNAPQIPYVSNVTGVHTTDDEATDPGYWARHLRQTVRFSDGLQTLLHDFNGVLVEVGPGQTLSLLARQQIKEGAPQVVVASMPHPQEPEPEEATILRALGRLWLAGVAIDWGGFYTHEQRRRLPLPSYPFERKRHWIAPPLPLAHPAPPPAAPEALEANVNGSHGDQIPRQREEQPAALDQVVAEPLAVVAHGDALQPTVVENGSPARVSRKQQRRAALEAIVAQQLAIMSEQMHVLRGSRARRESEE